MFNVIYMKSFIRLVVIFFALVNSSVLCAAQSLNSSPVGYWLIKTAQGNHDRSIVRLEKDKSGRMNGYLVATFYVEGRPWSNSSRCVKCSYGFEGVPLRNMEIITGLTASGHDWNSVWSGGMVYNADTDKMYKLKVEQVDGGKRLKITGCLKTIHLCKASYWHRVSSKDLSTYLDKAKSDKQKYTHSVDRS